MAFRRWWVAQLTSNVGSWMQTVAAQWLMISLTSSAILVGAIQATNLPVLALAIPGGVLGDLLDRKRLILFGQFVMLLSAAALGVLDVAGAVTPAVLLIVLCGIGVGQGLTASTAQTLQPELVAERTASSGDRARVGEPEPRPGDRAGDRWTCCSPRRARPSCSSSTRFRSSRS